MFSDNVYMFKFFKCRLKSRFQILPEKDATIGTVRFQQISSTGTLCRYKTVMYHVLISNTIKVQAKKRYEVQYQFLKPCMNRLQISFKTVSRLEFSSFYKNLAQLNKYLISIWFMLQAFLHQYRTNIFSFGLTMPSLEHQIPSELCS